jgi:hypothetical protein
MTNAVAAAQEFSSGRRKDLAEEAKDGCDTRAIAPRRAVLGDVSLNELSSWCCAAEMRAVAYSANVSRRQCMAILGTAVAGSASTIYLGNGGWPLPRPTVLSVPPRST